MSKPPLILDYYRPPGVSAGSKWRRPAVIQFLKILGVTVAAHVVIIGSICIYRAYENHSNLTKAKAHILLISNRLRGDPRFSQVTLSESDASNGCILVCGTVSTYADRDALREIVDSTSPPVEMRWEVWATEVTEADLKWVREYYGKD